MQREKYQKLKGQKWNKKNTLSHHTSAKILLSVRLIKINQKVSACQSKKQFDLNVVENSLERKNETKNNIKRNKKPILVS